MPRQLHDDCLTFIWPELEISLGFGDNRVGFLDEIGKCDGNNDEEILGDAVDIVTALYPVTNENSGDGEDVAMAEGVAAKEIE